jgi:chromosome segregation ATPase
MKRALSVAMITTLSLLVFLFVGTAQVGGAISYEELLDQELAAMESAFGGLQTFMAELITEVKGNMSGVDAVNQRVDQLRRMVEAVSIEIKAAEGRILGLKEDVDALGRGQQELKVRIVALEAGLSELSAFVDGLSDRVSVMGSDLGTLRGEFDALVSAYEEFYGAFEAFQSAVYGDIDALRDSVYADLSTLRDDVYADLGEMNDGFSADISMLSFAMDDLALRVEVLEKEDVASFKKKVIDLERSMAALAIRIDNNRARIDGIEHAIAGFSDEMAATRDSVIAANQEMLLEYDARLSALESVDYQSQIDTLYFISIVALLAGVGGLIWSFLGGS